MAIEIGGIVHYTPGELAEAGLRGFLPVIRIGAMNYVPETELANIQDPPDMSDIPVDHYLHLPEAASRIGLTVEAFEDYLRGNDLLPAVAPVVYQNRWYLSGEDLGEFDERFNGDYLSMRDASDVLKTSEAFLEDRIQSGELTGKRVAGSWWVSRAGVERLSRDPRVDKDNYVSALDASVQLRVSTVDLRKDLEKGRIPGKKSGNEWYIPREALVSMLDKTATDKPQADSPVF
jgi:hypothetical protein